MNPTIVLAAVYSVLSGDATLATLAPGGVWTVRPPVGTVFPYVRIRIAASPAEDWTMGAGRIMRLRCQIDAACEGYTAEPAHLALARVDALLTDATFNPSSGKILYCRRENFPGDTSEEVGGKPYQMAHANYLIDAQP